MQYRRKGIPAGIMYNTTTMDYEVVEEEHWADYMMGVRYGEFDIIENIKKASVLKAARVTEFMLQEAVDDRMRGDLYNVKFRGQTGSVYLTVSLFELVGKDARTIEKDIKSHCGNLLLFFTDHEQDDVYGKIPSQRNIDPDAVVYCFPTGKSRCVKVKVLEDRDGTFEADVTIEFGLEVTTEA